jgi:hypothetical protein
MAKSVARVVMRTRCAGAPPIFRSNADALWWSVEQGAFLDELEAQHAFAALASKRPAGLWARWLGLVGKRLEEQPIGAYAQGRLLRVP